MMASMMVEDISCHRMMVEVGKRRELFFRFFARNDNLKLFIHQFSPIG
jgi:hypothetical protein